MVASDMERLSFKHRLLRISIECILQPLNYKIIERSIRVRGNLEVLTDAFFSKISYNILFRTMFRTAEFSKMLLKNKTGRDPVGDT